MQNDSMKKNVLFLCTHNAVRSQMAEAFLNHLYGDRYSALSAGSDPIQIDPLVVTMMKEIDMDLSANQSKSLSVFQDMHFDCETQISKTNTLKGTIGALKFVSRTIPHSGGYDTPQLAAELGSRACPGVHTRDCVITVCDQVQESCSYFPRGDRHIHKRFSDPSKFQGNAEEVIHEYRRVRDQIKAWVEKEFNQAMK